MAGEKKELRREIERLLRELRPDRYTKTEKVIEGAGSGEDEESGIEPVNADDGQIGDEWLFKVVDQVKDLVPETEVRKLYAERLVREVEGSKTQSANQTLRQIRKTGQRMLGWLDLGRDPVAIVNREPLWGGSIRIREERVVLSELRRQDIKNFEIHERRRAARESRIRHDTCDAAQWILEQMIAAGAAKLGDWMEDAAEELATGTDD